MIRLKMSRTAAAALTYGIVAIACGDLPVSRGSKAFAAEGAAGSIGLFEDHADIGTVLHPGKLEFDAGKQTYTITASGENMWFKADAFHFAWKKVVGDVALEADISFSGAGKNPHRKACLLIRQSLAADSAYADAALHGSGLTSLQYREDAGAATHEIQSDIAAPQRLRIEKRGQYIYMFLANQGEPLHFAGGSGRLAFKDPLYVGLGVCSHEKDVSETAVFSNVQLIADLPPSNPRPVLYSSLETITIASTDRRVMHVAKGRIEAPNWMPDGTSLLFNGAGRIFRVPVAGGTPEVVDTGSAIRCNNDHGISPDGKRLAISDQSAAPHQSLIYVVPIGGGTPRRITERFPSYWHGWSPDGKTLAFCGQREGKFGIFTIPADGGDEKRLTTTDGLDDGPEYSPDGKYIYFNSDRSGTMQIWRMRPDGTAPEQVTADDWNNWFPHISPDGRSMVFLSYEKNVMGHPENKDVALRIMVLEDGRGLSPFAKRAPSPDGREQKGTDPLSAGRPKIDILAKLFGGQGTINVPSWSPDSRRLAFVSYHLLP
jgi:TolB protein